MGLFIFTEHARFTKEVVLTEKTMNRFALATKHRMLLGVCAGLAYTFGIPVWIVRVITFIFAVLTTGPFLLYLVVYFFAPKWNPEPEDFGARIG